MKSLYLVIALVIFGVIGFVIFTDKTSETEIADNKAITSQIEGGEEAAVAEENIQKQEPPMDFSSYATITELKTEDLKAGTGKEVVDGSTVSVHYTGWLTDGTQFDTSRKGANQPFTLTVGEGSVIAGWEEGLKGMKAGGQRRLYIPYTMGYGEGGYPGVIPPKATLVFDVELVNVQ